MKVDFYQLGDTPLHEVIASLAGKVLDGGERLLVVMSDENQLGRLDRLLWDEGETSFLAHGIAGGADDSRQPILLSTTPEPANQARNILLADGEWREAALSYERAFHLFDETSLAEARLAWKLLAGRDGVERRYWAREDGRWVNKG
ncbi:DNA polymerase III subunit chi [Sphingomonas astaxanthinifaciens]|uniref:DNA polymerase III subunit chi n=1 Tax=Sphingomonas astaxanthinifaciens DSM 22298 TaxID=1123267 RepID=A0ABQ5Z0Y9_9SPHN|nr:DNA polymerase III subunit chi [Sphingomonas astaxanthinifaciens]GLR46418.1 DNA polymerase III subunit chi [Sphingomonas astaxanthinifaciens DSM 22298]